MLTARHLSGLREAQQRRLTVIAYDPGQVFGTGLAKDLSWPRRTAWSLLGTPLAAGPLSTLNRHLNGRAVAGRILAELAATPAMPPAHRVYAALRGGQLGWPEPSQLARREDLAQALWPDSGELAGLPA